MGWTIGTLSARQVSTGNPITLAVTIAPGEKLFVVPLVSNTSTARAGGDLTLGSITLTQAGSRQIAATSPEQAAEMWYTLNPPAGNYTLTIPNSGALSIRYHACAAIPSGGGGLARFITAGGSNATSTNPSATTTGIGEGSLILFAVVGSGATTWAPSACTGTQISDTDAGANGDGFQYLIVANPPAGGSQAMGWTFGTSDDWGLCVGVFGETLPPAMENYHGVTVGDGMGTGERIR
jgi:hypothetical protein